MTSEPAAAAGRKDPVLEVLRYSGAALLAGVGGIHLDLWITGYRHIHTIGPLFLVQVVVSFVLALAVAVFRQWFVAVGAALFGLGTMASYEAFRLWTILGFHEIRTTAGFTAGVLEVLAFVALGGYALLVQQRSTAPSAALRAPIQRAMGAGSARLGAVGAVVAVVLVAVVGVSAVPRHTGTSSAGDEKAGITITIQGFAFHPARFTVTPREVVKVVNDDGVTHTVTATPGSKPDGGFDTGDIAPGGSMTFVAPSTAGAYDFQCTVHPFMTGVLTVS